MKKKIVFIKKHLSNYYDLQLQTYKTISYNVYPSPNIKIIDAKLKTNKKDSMIIESENLSIFLKLSDIYQLDNSSAKKILLKNNSISLDISKLNLLANFLNRLKYKAKLENLDLKLLKNESPVIVIKDIRFVNYGFHKNKVFGKVFEKKFRINFENNKSINFKILKSGVNANIVLDDKKKKNLLSGDAKINILKNFFKINFNFNKDIVNIFNSNFSSEDLKMKFESSINYFPYFMADSKFIINSINSDFFKIVDIEKFLEKKQLIKKMNSNNIILFEPKKYKSKFIKNLKIQFNLAHGRLNFSKNIILYEGEISCTGESLLIEEFPRIDFNCLMKISDKTKFIKKFDINRKFTKNSSSLSLDGSLNLLNKKINLNELIIDNSKVKSADIKFFKQSFENILFDKNLLSIFSKNKISKFILEII